MTLRVYDGARGSKERRQYEGYIDRYSLYFPYPNRWKTETYKKYGEHISGEFLGFSFSKNGSNINRCCWNQWNLRDGNCGGLGKKVKINTLPEPVQKWIHGYEIAWNNLINNPEDEDVIKAWEDYF